MTARLIEAALTAAIASAVVMVSAAAAGWIDPARVIVVVGGVSVAGAALAAVQHVTGLTTLATIEPAPNRPQEVE